MTGSKTLEECLNIINRKSNLNSNINSISKDKKYFFRTKSIRSDFKVDNLSFSLSCTDKIMIRNILGYQGKYLSFLIEPIFLKSLIINNKLDKKMIIIKYLKIVLIIIKKIYAINWI